MKTLLENDMIRILFFIETLSGGGAEKVLRTLVNNMDQSRFQITVMTVWPENCERYLNSGIQYRSVYPERNGLNRLRYRLEAALNLTYPIHIKGDYHIEVAYLECGPTKIMAGSTNSNASKMAWVHCDLKKKADDLAAFVRKSSDWYSKYDKVICVSETVRDSYVDLFGNEPESVVIHNCVDHEEILSKSKAGLPAHVRKRKMTVTTVGRMYAEKGYDRLLCAHKRLLDEGYDYDLWILGDGPEQDSLTNYIVENGLEDSVSLLGFQSNPYPFMDISDLIVCSSRYEGFSTVVTEALILGKPVVTTDCSGMHELLGNNEYGMIVDNSEDGIYHGLKTMLDQPALLAEYEGKAALRGKEFSKDLLVKRTEDFFIQMSGE